VRLWQLGIQMKPLFYRRELWLYPLYAAVGGGFGYWLQGAGDRHDSMLQERKEMLLEKRRRRAEREAAAALGGIGEGAAAS
jgi:hypothetical protein